ncbi:FAD/NAD(P)-binding domain-containing protein [Gonapodya prolifera JEL478]|uniref:NADH:ubiquinone reductase (non-electrogenic) n=1 Tax=Gonapodya prolifera (strain JEL478) TaxID=1344416 RepID=A0A138ZYA1_GONPJ|nr:FAD/NAD(P)-binding domain-containing protein [Gonapodya prolifera JEL478]|eukprot:KXS09245.1 FAD/NAD(P)-binding domain-containing protein [Gonapodya prolifera JEL478]
MIPLHFRGKLGVRQLPGIVSRLSQNGHANPPLRRSLVAVSSSGEVKRRRWLPLFGTIVGAAGLTIGYGLYTIHWLNHPSPDQLPFGDPSLPTIVLLGSGWGAASFLKEIDTKNWNVVVVSPRNYFLFTPLLPSCTVGTIELRSLMLPLRYITMHKKREVKFVEADATDIDPGLRTVTFEDKSEIRGEFSRGTLKYDYLVVGVGAETTTFGTKGVTEHAIFLKEIPDAVRIRRAIMDSLETAAFPGQSPAEIDRLLHFVIVGGGPTGVEYAAELRDFFAEDIRKWFPAVAKHAKITLIDSRSHILGTFDQKLVEHAEKAFKRENIEHMANTRVKEVREKEIVIAEKHREIAREIINGVAADVEKEVVKTSTVPYGVLVWAGGNGIRPFTANLISKLDPALQREAGRGLSINDNLAVLGAECMYAIGDCTVSKLAPTAQVASQQGAYLARMFSKFSREIDSLTSAGSTLAEACTRAGDSLKKTESFTYKHLGSLAYVGDEDAIADLPLGMKLSGAATFWFWKSVYLSNMLNIRNRVLVAFDWTKAWVFGRDISRA